MSSFNWFGHQSRFVVPPPAGCVKALPATGHLLSSLMRLIPFVVRRIEHRPIKVLRRCKGVLPPGYLDRAHTRGQHVNRSPVWHGRGFVPERNSSRGDRRAVKEKDTRPSPPSNSTTSEAGNP